jgi:hypothetical protein
MQSLGCAADTCTVKDASGNTVESGFMRLLPRHVLHLRHAPRINADQLLVKLSDESSTTPVDHASLAVTVNGVAATRLSREQHYPYRVRFAFPRAATMPASIDIALTAALTVNARASVEVVDSTVTCRVCDL